MNSDRDTDTWIIVLTQRVRPMYVTRNRSHSDRATAQQYIHRQTNEKRMEISKGTIAVSVFEKARVHTITFSRCIFSRWISQIHSYSRKFLCRERHFIGETVKSNNHHFCGNASGSLGIWHGPLSLYQTPYDCVFVPQIALGSRNVWNLIMMGFCLCLCLLSKFPLSANIPPIFSRSSVHRVLVDVYFYIIFVLPWCCYGCEKLLLKCRSNAGYGTAEYSKIHYL